MLYATRLGEVSPGAAPSNIISYVLIMFYPFNFHETLIDKTPRFKVIKKEIRTILVRGIIKHSTSEFNSPLWVVPKKVGYSGTPPYCVAVDYRELNKVTRAKYYSGRGNNGWNCGGGEWKCSGYSTLSRMHLGDRRKTAFQRLADEATEGVGKSFAMSWRGFTWNSSGKIAL